MRLGGGLDRCGFGVVYLGLYPLSVSWSSPSDPLESNRCDFSFSSLRFVCMFELLDVVTLPSDAATTSACSWAPVGCSSRQPGGSGDNVAPDSVRGCALRQRGCAVGTQTHKPTTHILRLIMYMVLDGASAGAS